MVNTTLTPLASKIERLTKLPLVVPPIELVQCPYLTSTQLELASVLDMPVSFVPMPILNEEWRGVLYLRNINCFSIWFRSDSNRLKFPMVDIRSTTRASNISQNCH